MYRRQLSYYFSTPIAYIAIALYLLTISLLLWVVPGQWNIIDSGYAQVDGLFAIAPWLLLLLCPALTMQLFAEERLSGTWELLLTKPVSLGRIVLGKYFAAWTVVLLAQLPCLVHLAAVSVIAEPAGNIDSGAFICAFTGLVLVSASLTAIGTWAASIAKSQIVCFLVAFIAGFLVFYAFDLISPRVAPLGLNYHLQSLSAGVMDLRDIVYFFTVTTLFAALAILQLKHTEV